MKWHLLKMKDQILNTSIYNRQCPKLYECTVAAVTHDTFQFQILKDAKHQVKYTSRFVVHSPRMMWRIAVRMSVVPWKQYAMVSVLPPGIIPTLNEGLGSLASGLS